MANAHHAVTVRVLACVRATTVVFQTHATEPVRMGISLRAVYDSDTDPAVARRRAHLNTVRPFRLLCRPT